MRYVDRPAPGWLVSRRLRLLAAGRLTGLLGAGGVAGGGLAAGRVAGGGALFIGLFQCDLFPDRLLFPRGFLISHFLVGRLAGTRFLIACLLRLHLLIRRLLIGRLMIGRLRSGGFVIGRPGRRFRRRR
ncbi:MAG: hypothetical protein ACR2MP_22250 [Streptosporangiaceae bacterium]